MTGIEVALVGVGLAGVAFFASLATRFAERRAARRAYVGQPVPELEARLQPAAVPLKVKVLTATEPGDYGTRIIVEGVCARLTLRKERPPEPTPRPDGSQLRPAPPPPELETGDPDFDAVFFVLGPPTLVHALLDAETRRLLLKLARHQQPGDVVVENGQLCVDEPLSSGLNPQAVEARGRQVVALARRLLEPDVAARLAQNCQRDPLAAVRLRNLKAAVREDPNNPMTRAMLSKAASDRDHDVRLLAGLALGPDGREALLSVLEDNAADDAAVETALEALSADVPDEALLERILQRSLGVQPGDVPLQPRSTRACLKALSRARTPQAASRLQALLLVNAFLADDTARALGGMGGEDAEAALIGALGCDVEESRRAAAEVLGSVGTIAAVTALHEAARHGGDLRRVARLAITEIQARAHGAPGAVSLAGSEAGQVSMAEDPAGRVSLPAGERARER